MNEFSVIENQKQYREQLALRYKLMLINKIANFFTLVIIAFVGFVIYLRVIN